MRKYRREMTIGIVALLFADLAGLSIPWLLKMVVDELPNNPSDSDLLRFGGMLFGRSYRASVIAFWLETIFVWPLSQSRI